MSDTKGISKQKKTQQSTLTSGKYKTTARITYMPLTIIVSGTRHDLSQEQKEFVRRTIRDFIASKNPRMVQGF
jgi:hypothetical protein